MRQIALGLYLTESCGESPSLYYYCVRLVENGDIRQKYNIWTKQNSTKTQILCNPFYEFNENNCGIYS